MPKIPEDANLVFCHDDLISNKIISSVERRFATGQPVKMILWGDWGVGKTHLTYHLQWWFRENMDDFPAKPVLIEIGDLTRKSRFDEIVRKFLDRLGLPFIIQLVTDYRGECPNVQSSLCDRGISNNIAEAYAKFLLSSPGQTPVPLVAQTFEYLKGRKISGSDAVGLGSPLVESDEFYHVLLGLGQMYRTVHGHQMVFIADEATRLETVESEEATRQHWMTTNKLIFDDQNDVFGFIGKQVFELKTLATNDVETFLAKLVEEFVEKDKVEALVSAGEIDSSDYTWENYPFTDEARTDFIDHFNRAQENSKPRDISQSLDDLAFIAGKLKKRLIDRDCLTLNEM
jgi:hypothetical protein